MLQAGCCCSFAPCSPLILLLFVDNDIEIVELDRFANGRSCSLHLICGESVMVGDILRLVECVITMKNKTKIAIKCVKVMDGIDTCTVAFVPRDSQT